MKRPKIPNDFLPPAGRTTLLPQYMQSDTMDSRFNEAIQTPGKKQIARMVKPPKGPYHIDTLEETAENLVYFRQNKEKLEREFWESLCETIGNDAADRFCSTIRDFWFDGLYKRQGPQVQQLMASIRDYYIAFHRYRCRHEIPVSRRPAAKTAASFQTGHIEAILTLNQSMLDAYLPEWLRGHARFEEKTMDDVFFRRGLAVNRLPKPGPYKEYRYINAYSLAITVSEQFAQIGNKVKAMIHQHQGDTTKRILFFAPFIPAMEGTQLELGIIPAYRPQVLSSQDKHAGVHEYLVEYPSIHPNGDIDFDEDGSDLRERDAEDSQGLQV